MNERACISLLVFIALGELMTGGRHVSDLAGDFDVDAVAFGGVASVLSSPSSSTDAFRFLLRAFLDPNLGPGLSI